MRMKKESIQSRNRKLSTKSKNRLKNSEHSSEADSCHPEELHHRLGRFDLSLGRVSATWHSPLPMYTPMGSRRPSSSYIKGHGEEGCYDRLLAHRSSGLLAESTTGPGESRLSYGPQFSSYASPSPHNFNNYYTKSHVIDAMM